MLLLVGDYCPQISVLIAPPLHSSQALGILRASAYEDAEQPAPEGVN